MRAGSFAPKLGSPAVGAGIEPAGWLVWANAGMAIKAVPTRATERCLETMDSSREQDARSRLPFQRRGQGDGSVRKRGIPADLCPMPVQPESRKRLHLS